MDFYDKIQKFMIIAHRGASYDAPENTLASFRLGFEQNADAIECDIHLSAENEVVVIHDDSTKRTAGLDIGPAELAELRGPHTGIADELESLAKQPAAGFEDQRVFVIG